MAIFRQLRLQIIAVAVVVTGVLIGLAANPATGQSHWPWGLDVIRRHPFPAIAVLVAAASMLTLIQLFQQPSAATAGDPPVPTVPIVAEWIVDREQVRQVAAAVRARGRRGGFVGITTGVYGAGGFGKTTVARLVCADRRVRRRFRGRVYEVSIGREVRGRAAIAAKVADVTRFITGDTTVFDDPVLAGAHLGRLLAQRPRTLLMLDDVWEPEQLAPFLASTGGKCVRLVTTRVPGLMPTGAEQVRVDRMSRDQAHRVLTDGLPTLSPSVTEEIISAAGGWALLLRLANQAIAKSIRRGDDPHEAALSMLTSMAAHGPVAVDDPVIGLDLDNPAERARTVRATVEAAVAFLPASWKASDRLSELGVFAEDETIPASLITALWRATGDLDAKEARGLCLALAELSLISWDPGNGGQVKIHDVVRDYLRAELKSTGIRQVNESFVASVSAGLPVEAALGPGSAIGQAAWWRAAEGYLLDHGIEHLLAAGRTIHAEAVATDLRWITARLHQRGPAAAISDLERITTASAAERAQDLARISHLLDPTEPEHALTAILHSRLAPLAAWSQQISALSQAHSDVPALRNAWSPPDLPDPRLLRALIGHVAPVRTVTISPDGTWLASADDDGTVRIWDRQTGTNTSTLVGHASRVTKVATGPDGSWLVTTGHDRTMRFWDRATGRTTAVIDGYKRTVQSAAIGPDGSWLATVSYDRTVRIWDRATRTNTATLTGHTDWIQAVAISPDGTWLATGAYDRALKIWDRTTGTNTATLTGHKGLIRAVAISADGTWLASAGDDKTVRIWDRATGTNTATLTGHTHWIHAVAISPDGTWLATAGDDKTVRIWDRVTGTNTATLVGHTDSVQSLEISPDGTWLASASEDGTVRIWGHPSGAVPATAVGRSSAVQAAAVSADGVWLASAGDDKTVRIWDRATGTNTATLVGHTDWIQAVAISPDGTWLATAADDRTVRVWDRVAGAVIATLVGHAITVQSLAISPDGSWLAVPGNEHTVRIWNRATGAVTAIRTSHSGQVRVVAISPDGAWLATAADDQSVRISDRITGTTTATLVGHTGPIQTLAISPDGAWIAIAGNDQAVRIWERTTGTIMTLTGHTAPVRTVSISPDGAWLASAGNDHTLRVWDVGTGRPVAMMRTENILTSCTWTPDQRGLVVGGQGGLYLYDFVTGQVRP